MSASDKLARRNDGGIDRQDHGTEPGTDAVAPGSPTRVGGRVLLGLMALTFVVWIVSLTKVVQQPSQQGSTTTSWDLAFWVAMALASAIATFILGFWKVHRT